MQDDHISEAMVPACLHQLSQHQASPVDALAVGQHQAHLLQASSTAAAWQDSNTAAVSQDSNITAALQDSSTAHM
jgi:hypothetical protein